MKFFLFDKTLMRSTDIEEYIILMCPLLVVSQVDSLQVEVLHTPQLHLSLVSGRGFGSSWSLLLKLSVVICQVLTSDGLQFHSNKNLTFSLFQS